MPSGLSPSLGGPDAHMASGLFEVVAGRGSFQLRPLLRRGGPRGRRLEVVDQIHNADHRYVVVTDRSY
jgi:hypothetical protein